MQIFLISKSPIETAMVLDKKRLNKQILECDWIINGWKKQTRPTSHPIAKMYKDHLFWVEMYRKCLSSYRSGDLEKAKSYSCFAEDVTPSFLCQEYFDNFKKRLYTKDPCFYKQFEKYGTTEENWYFLGGKWKIYVKGKCIGEKQI